ncbi:immunity protein Tsi6 family protein [Agarivorans sp. 1_MG-2023]|uniref:immunity protein Tsi6 family protein n=1 Tax=Agarivorans sp. 1_MG-2023 TaxID=3062634 RepID=UPI0026E361DB|nr:immunity protein Tsi6 family protein [Agarivorans sp. 1_MG-2023]MDO6762396.1 immunity protein Tsi6 family protein [Agarivorans sp. 1_MG-2023]
MNIPMLTVSSSLALTEFSKKSIPSIEGAIYDSIIEQLKFILHEAKRGHNPRNNLPRGKIFTYGVLASRNFASPEELKLKALLDEVTSHLYPEDYQ